VSLALATTGVTSMTSMNGIGHTVLAAIREIGIIFDF